ncbi:hypothetical protein [Streptomyces sp. NPDC091371]|uniref:hypothetical protein n=1 Tax=Streptomyces sp. NPDC091371 TaxID=3155303 RepID=UPI003421266D
MFIHVCAAFGSDARTERVLARLLDGGAAWMSGSIGHGRCAMGVPVSNWSTTNESEARPASQAAMPPQLPGEVAP